MDPQRENGFACPMCSKTFSLKGNLKHHMVTHDPDAKVKCEICGKISKNRVTLSFHIKGLHTSRNRPSCDICHRLFFNDTTLRKHIDAVHSTMKRPRFPCGFPDCEKTYANRDGVSRHMKIEHAENPTRFRCTLCSKEFKEKGNLKAHISTHTTEKTYTCSTCGKSFSYSNSLKSHEATHLEKSTRRIFKCHLCPQISLRRPHLQKHIEVVHENQRHHPCTLCDKKFNTLSHMRRHVEAIHPANSEKIHSCDQCEYKSHLRGNLAEHARRHNPANRRECYFCQKQFVSFSELVAHCRRHTQEQR